MKLVPQAFVSDGKRTAKGEGIVNHQEGNRDGGAQYRRQDGRADPVPREFLSQEVTIIESQGKNDYRSGVLRQERSTEQETDQEQISRLLAQLRFELQVVDQEEGDK